MLGKHFNYLEWDYQHQRHLQPSVFFFINPRHSPDTSGKADTRAMLEPDRRLDGQQPRHPELVEGQQPRFLGQEENNTP